MHHFIERGGDQPGEPDDVSAHLPGSGEDLLTGDHHPKIGNFESVAGQYDANDILAYIVHVPLDRGHHYLASGTLTGIGRLFLFHEGGEPGHGLLHDPGGLDYLGQEHLSGAKEISHDRHSVHEGALDDLEWSAVLEAGLLSVSFDKLGNSLEQRMLKALLYWLLPPPEINFLFLSFLPPELLGKLQELVGGIASPVEDHILDPFKQVGRNFVINLKHPRIDNPHVHSGTGSVIQEGRVHGFPDHVVAPKGEGDIGDPPGNPGMRQAFLDPAGCFDEVDSVVVMFRDSGGDGQDVRVEDDVLGREVHLVDEDTVGAFTDPDLI